MKASTCQKSFEDPRHHPCHPPPGLGKSCQPLFLTDLVHLTVPRTGPPLALPPRHTVRERREPRGFAFIQFEDSRDAEVAKDRLDRTDFLGREISVMYAQDRRKKPEEMMRRDRGPPRRRDYDSDDDRRRDRDRGRGMLVLQGAMLYP